jgi:hypothetical protein
MPEAAPVPSRRDDLREFVLALFHQWQALIVGFAFSFALAVVPAMLGKEVPPWLWGLAIGLAVLPASFLAWRKEHGRVEQLEGEFRGRKRTQEAKDFNVPFAYRRGSLARAAAVAKAQTPLGLQPESNAELDRLIGHAIAGLDRDCLYIIKREMLAETLGPFDAQRGRYGRLPWADVRAEIAKLRLDGLIEPVTPPDAGPVLYRWTAFGYAVIGKLGPKLR